ncbi:MAG: hypothetical protein KH015_05265 [Gordonibacter pamelaeae]|uniref:DUF6870 family protein n=1 Tax=Eggerthellaceae TaxID=1643826 RepID=UPI000DF7F1E4|nr:MULTISPECIES: hypothetical protein [Eggerthellaceae]MBS4895181.1 hypothetical protein [Gordonibacter pamelaeae]MDU5258104.1 hypothetical protein [Eggerthella sp.]RDC16694.1 hypothetical protein C1861_03845 [Eggerthella lenta]HJH74561.1 hypothetical protein [Eggerthellaceae bacterium]
MEKQLVDIADVVIDKGKPAPERIADFVGQVGDPYDFLCHGVHVRVSFAGQVSVERAVARCLGVEDGDGRRI